MVASTEVVGPAVAASHDYSLEFTGYVEIYRHTKVGRTEEIKAYRPSTPCVSTHITS